MEPDDFSVQVVAAGGASARTRRVALCFAWRRVEPLLVSLTLTSVPDHPSLPRGAWEMLLDFLRYGLDEPTGDGDVRMVPDAEAGLVRMELARTAPKPVTLSVPMALVRGFLDATETLVPTGELRSEESVDELIRRLLEWEE